MNVDLGHFVASDHLELIELKAGPHADTPLKATFEIVGYGLLYSFGRAHRVQLALPRGNRVLDAKRVDLKVLAPCEVYAGYRLNWLETSLDAGVKRFSKHRLATQRPLANHRFGLRRHGRPPFFDLPKDPVPRRYAHGIREDSGPTR